MVDKREEIILESIRRFVQQSEEGVDDVVAGMADCPMLKFIDPEEIKRLAALNIAMVRIIESTDNN